MSLSPLRAVVKPGGVVLPHTRTVLAMAGITAMLVMSRAPLVDAETGTPATDVALHLPGAYLALAPLASLLDTLSLLTVRQHVAFGLSLIVGALLLARPWRGWFGVAGRRSPPHRRLRAVGRLLAVAAGTLGALVIVYAAGALLPRPMARLRVAHAGSARTVVVDFHSHTVDSHDGRPGFTVEANRAWHRAAGFDVAYITDHNRLATARFATRLDGPADADVVVLPGVEYTRDGEHVVSLGVDGRTSPGHAEAPVVIHTIPEPLARVHPRGGPSVHGAGVAGIELADACPRGLEQAAVDRGRILRLADSLDLAVVSASNNHGWGRTAAAWSLVDIPDWGTLRPVALDSAIQAAILRRRRHAVRVVLRAPVPGSQSAIGLGLTLPAVAWTTNATLPLRGRLVTVLWLAVVLLLPALARYVRRSGDAAVPPGGNESGPSAGSVTTNRDPPGPESESATSPPCAAPIHRAMASPSPAPAPRESGCSAEREREESAR